MDGGGRLAAGIVIERGSPATRNDTAANRHAEAFDANRTYAQCATRYAEARQELAALSSPATG